MGEWKTYTIAELAAPGKNALATGPFGSAISSRHFLNDGVPVIRGANLSLDVGTRISDGDVVFISAEKADEFKRSMATNGDLVFTCWGTIGQVGLIDNRARYNRYIVSNKQMKLSLDKRLTDPLFMYYAMSSPAMVSRVQGAAIGSSVPGFNLTQLRAITLSLPTLSEQRAIAEVLGALDDKIALNERIVATVSELTRAVMEELWSKGDVASLVRGDAAVPHAWRRTTLAALCTTGGGAIQTGPFGSQLHASDYVDFGIPSVMPQNIGDNRISEDGIARITAVDAERLSKYLLAEGDIVYSRRGDVKRRALVRQYETGWLCGTGCLRVRVGTATEPLFMSYYLGESEVQEWIAQHAVGATMPNLNTTILGAVPVVMPPSDELLWVTERLAGPDAMAAHLQQENRTLADLRDTLLPLLLSGKRRVKDAVRTVEEVV